VARAASNSAAARGSASSEQLEANSGTANFFHRTILIADCVSPRAGETIKDPLNVVEMILLDVSTNLEATTAPSLPSSRSILNGPVLFDLVLDQTAMPEPGLA
jgi:hypothetical protein